MSKSTSDLVRFLLNYFNLDEVRTLAFMLNVRLDDLPYTTKSEAARELIAYLDRHGRLEELEALLAKERPKPFSNSFTQSDSGSDDRSRISIPGGGVRVESYGGSLQPSLFPEQEDVITRTQLDLSSTRQSIEELKQLIRQQNSAGSVQFLDSLDEMNKSIRLALGRTEELKADLILPSLEDRRIQLIPEHKFERLQEYKADENIAYLLIGLFAGAAVGVLVNWATNDTFSPTPVSLTFLGVFAALALGSIGWVYRIHKRSTTIISQIYPDKARS